MACKAAGSETYNASDYKRYKYHPRSNRNPPLTINMPPFSRATCPYFFDISKCQLRPSGLCISKRYPIAEESGPGICSYGDLFCHLRMVDTTTTMSAPKHNAEKTGEIMMKEEECDTQITQTRRRRLGREYGGS